MRSEAEPGEDVGELALDDDHGEMAFEEVAGGLAQGEEFLAAVDPRGYGVGEGFGVAGGNEGDRGAVFGLGGVAGAELVDDGSATGHCLIDFVSDDAGGFLGGAEDAEDDVGGSDDAWDVDVGDLFEEGDVGDSLGFFLGGGLVGAPSQEVPVDVEALGHACGLDDGLGAVQRQVGAMVEDAEGGGGVMRRVVLGAVGGAEDLFVGAGEEDAQFFAGDAHARVEEVRVAGGVAEQTVDGIEQARLPGEEAFRARLVGRPFFLLQDFFVPGGDHGVEGDGDAAFVGPAGGGGGIALAGDGDPDEVGSEPFWAAQGVFQIAQRAAPFDGEDRDLPSQFLEEGDVDAVAGVGGVEAAPPEDGLFHGRGSSRSSI